MIAESIYWAIIYYSLRIFKSGNYIPLFVFFEGILREYAELLTRGI